MPGASDRLSFGAMLLFESVKRNDTPWPVFGKCADPVQVGCIAWKTIRQMDDAFDAGYDEGKFSDAVGKML